MAEELKACPFCGGRSNKCEDSGWVACSSAKCPAYNFVGTEDDWNTRAQLPSQGGEAVEIEYPTYHAQGMGCGLEERDAALKQVEGLRAAIKQYEVALRIAYPKGATGDAFVAWNAARQALQAKP